MFWKGNALKLLIICAMRSNSNWCDYKVLLYNMGNYETHFPVSIGFIVNQYFTMALMALNARPFFFWIVCILMINHR